MRHRFTKIASAAFGDPRRVRLEHRLFSTISLLNALTNFGGAVALLGLQNHRFLIPLHLVTGLLFLLFYCLSRFGRSYRALYWPFVLTILAFLMMNAFGNAGSSGGAHYYLIPALVIATILSTSPRDTVIAILLFAAATATLLVIERVRPDWITPYASPEERFFDVTGNLIFAQAFTGLLVLVLTRNLNQERRKSDLLLRNVLPDSVAEELKLHDRVQPLAYPEASVLFTDFVGFTQIAEGFTPSQLVRELDHSFRHFDGVARRHRLEKIKTIGDAYLAVGGIPAANRTHAVDCVLAALDLRDYITARREEKLAAGETYWQVRVGVHTGELVAGVVGREKFAYDVWGDTVNTASRMESSGAPGRVNISNATYERVKPFFECEPRGLIAAKNKGEIEMHFVNRIRPELSLDPAGRTPNESFHELYRLMEKGRTPELTA